MTSNVLFRIYIKKAVDFLVSILVGYVCKEVYVRYLKLLKKEEKKEKNCHNASNM